MFLLMMKLLRGEVPQRRNGYSFSFVRSDCIETLLPFF